MLDPDKSALLSGQSHKPIQIRALEN